MSEAFFMSNPFTSPGYLVIMYYIAYFSEIHITTRYHHIVRKLMRAGAKGMPFSSLNISQLFNFSSYNNPIKGVISRTSTIR